MLQLDFAHAIASAGLTPPLHIDADGQIHRFSTSGKRHDNAGWYVLHSDGIPAGVFGCWRSGFQQTWCSQPLEQLSASEFAHLRHVTQHAKFMRQHAQQQRQQVTQQNAQSRWDKAKPVAQHPYATSKGIQPINLRTDSTGHLLVPMYSSSGALCNLQTIAANGRKLFLKDAPVQGCFYGVGTPSGALVVCEGVATAYSIHECTGLAVAAAFTRSNLAHVAKALHQAQPQLQLLIAADDDHMTEGNPGITDARAAALAVGGSVAVPHFPFPRPSKATDFNDLHAIAGPAAVRMCFTEVWEEPSHAI